MIKEYTKANDETETRTKKMGTIEMSSRKGVQRQDILRKYYQDVEQRWDEFPDEVNDHMKLPCRGCGKLYTRVFDESLSEDVCRECGTSEYVLGEEVGFKEEQELEKHVICSYKRENHFNEWVSQFQAKESTSVPPEIITTLRSEFKKQKVKDVSEITHEKVKVILKRINLSKYYEHVPYITTMLSGITPPTMPPELEHRLRLMFHAIQEPFEKHKPSDRKNFLSYSFVLYKMCELLGEDQYLPCFPLLKSKEKLYIQDRIWERMCEELQWEFIRTI